MRKENNIPLLDRIKQRQRLREDQAEGPNERDSAAKAGAGNAEAQGIDNILATGGFVQLSRALEAARGDFDFERRIVYIDDESAEVLDLLRKKAKIKSNLLVSYLLHEFLAKHKDLIREYVEKRGNKLID